MIRQLATIVVIESVSPHGNADSLEIVRMVDKDWQVVTRKGDFRPGDLAVFCETDSVMPKHPDLAFLDATGGKVRKATLRGVISQGLLLKADCAFVREKLAAIPPVGTNVSDALGVKLAEPKSEDAEAAFPTHIIPKNDEERAKSKLQLLDELKGLDSYISEKVDGTSSTFMLHSDEFIVCSKNNVLKKGVRNFYFEMAEKYNVESKLRAYKAKHGVELAVGAEIVGPGIQKNQLSLAEKEIRVFSVYDLGKRQLFGLRKMTEVCAELGLPMVNILWVGRYDFSTRREAIDNLYKMAEGKYDNSPNEREGVVVRPLEPVLSKVIEGGMSYLSFKYVTKEDALLTGVTIIGEVYLEEGAAHLGHRIEPEPGAVAADGGVPEPEYVDDLASVLKTFRRRKVKVTIEEFVDEE